MNPLRVLSIASEVFPLIKTGGLADVVGALPSALVVPPMTLIAPLAQVARSTKRSTTTAASARRQLRSVTMRGARAAYVRQSMHGQRRLC